MAFPDGQMTDFEPYADIKLAEDPELVEFIVIYEGENLLGSSIKIEMISEDLNEVWISEDGKEITDFGNEVVTVTFIVDPDKVNNWDDLKVVYVDKNGDHKEFIVPTSYDEKTGEVVAELSHFSIYGVFEIADEDNATDGKELPNTATNQYNWLLIGALLLFFGAVTLFVVKRKRLQS